MIRVAVTYENGNVFQHFGHSEKFKIYDVEDGHIVKADVIDTNGQGHGALVGFLQAQEVNAVIAGGIGGGASRPWRPLRLTSMAALQAVPMKPSRICSMVR
mgnify:FL=1